MAESFKLSVHVQPGARGTTIVGWVDDVLGVRIVAPPVEGKANEALIALLAKVLGVPKSSMRIPRVVLECLLDRWVQATTAAV